VSLRARLTTFVAVAVGLAVAVIAFFAYGFARDEARLEDDRFLVERGPAVGIFGSLDIEAIGRRPGLFGGPGQGTGAGSGPAQERDRTAPVGDIIREDAVAQFIDAGGFVLRFGEFGVVLPVDAADLELASNPGPDLLRDVIVDSVHYRMLTRHLGPGLAIQVARDVSGTDAILSGLRLRLTLLGILGAAAAAVVGWFVSRRSLRPVGLLTDAAEHVAATHDLEARIDLGREDELGRLAAAFNTMLAALEEARISQQRLVTDASHELRTPLTSLRTNIELLAMGGVRDEDRSELMADLTSEVGELSHLVSELVDLATIGRDEEPRPSWSPRSSSAGRAESCERFPTSSTTPPSGGATARSSRSVSATMSSRCGTTAPVFPRRISAMCSNGSIGRRRRDRDRDRGLASPSWTRSPPTTVARCSFATRPMGAP